MAKIELHPDFKEFLRLMNSNAVEYLLVGGYAVGYYGYPRATADMDIWIAVNQANAEKTAAVFRDFSSLDKQVSKDMFLEADKVIRMGVPPVRLEIITGASGVDFAECYARRQTIEVDGVPINLISLDDLKINKRASGRLKDLADLEHLP